MYQSTYPDPPKATCISQNILKFDAIYIFILTNIPKSTLIYPNS